MDSENKQSPSVVSDLIPKDIEYQAAHWLGVLDGDDPGAEHIAAFHQWKNEDETHHKAFEELLDLWGSANILTRLEPPAKGATATAAKESSGWAFSESPLRNIGAMAFTLLVMVGLVIMPPWKNTGEQTYTTQIGEQKTIVLPDRSQVLLNTDSQVTVDFQAGRRLLILKKGEAHFDVTPDPDRPFDVYAGGGRVNAVGTAFTVRMQRQGISVYVTEGVVEIYSEKEIPPSGISSTGESPRQELEPGKVAPGKLQTAQLGGADGVRVPAGQEATYGKKTGEPVAVAASANMRDKLSWRKGALVFKGEPLGEVIEEFSRYTSTKIIIPEQKMRSMKVGGIFKIGDTVAMLDALREGFGIRAKYVSDDIIYLVHESEQ